MDYLTRLAALQRLVVVDGVQLSTAGTTGASGPAASGGGSTGPFSGGTELSAVDHGSHVRVAGARPSSTAGAGDGARPADPGPRRRPPTTRQSARG